MLPTPGAQTSKLETEYLIKIYLAALHIGYKDDGSGTNQTTGTDD
jgi:hypothetical protein